MLWLYMQQKHTQDSINTIVTTPSMMSSMYHDDRDGKVSVVPVVDAFMPNCFCLN